MSRLITQLRPAASGCTEPHRALRSLTFPSALSLYPQGVTRLLADCWEQCARYIVHASTNFLVTEKKIT